MRGIFGFGVAVAWILLSFTGATVARAQTASTEAKYPPTTEGDFVVHNFKFKSGQSMDEVRLHYTTLGKPAQDAHNWTTHGHIEIASRDIHE